MMEANNTTQQGKERENCMVTEYKNDLSSQEMRLVAVEVEY